tara:strand:- start:89 stop:727 length:639 start_codon:yes stop_codon:yes gene_type:complete
MALTEKQKKDFLLFTLGVDEALLRGKGVVTRTFNLAVAGLIKAAKSARPAARPVGTGIGRAAGAIARGAVRGAPVIGAAVSAYDAYEMGKRDAEAIRSGEMSVPQALQTYPNPLFINPSFAETIGAPESVSTIDLFTPIAKGRRKVSKYSKAVKAGMEAVKKSKFNGKVGTIRNPKKTFATVSKTVSAVNKGRKAPRKGVRGVIARAARRYI